MANYRAKKESNIPLGMINILYGPRYSSQQSSSYRSPFLEKLREFGKLSPEEMAAQRGIFPKQRTKESKLPVICS